MLSLLFFYKGENMQSLKINPNRTITLPRSIFKPEDKLVLITEGDTLIIKKLHLSKLSKIASRVREKALSLKEITEEIHLYRKEKKTVSSLAPGFLRQNTLLPATRIY